MGKLHSLKRSIYLICDSYVLHFAYSTNYSSWIFGIKIFILMLFKFSLCSSICFVLWPFCWFSYMHFSGGKCQKGRRSQDGSFQYVLFRFCLRCQATCGCSILLGKIYRSIPLTNQSLTLVEISIHFLGVP